MRSSISSSDSDPTRPTARLASAERLTAADRPGVAQPVPERPIPTKPWGRMLLSVAVLTLVATALWEWRMRSLQLLPGDIRDNSSMWAEQRRRVDRGGVAVIIMGDSRILFGSDLDRFEALTGVKPLQLALAGTNARPFLEELAQDSEFNGLALVGISEGSYFRTDPGLYADALQRYYFESPSQRASFLLYRQLSKLLGFLDSDYRLSTLTMRLDSGLRAGAGNPYLAPWKLSTMREDRELTMWSRIETDAYLNGHARAFWALNFTRPPISAEVIAMTQNATREAVKAIRARGGEVIFLRPPSRGPVRANEDRIAPRGRVWDALLAAVPVKGLHAEDDPVASHLFLPEYSHVSRACSTVYTDSYVRGVARLTARLKIVANAPPPLSPNDCAPSRAALAVQKELDGRR